MEMMGGGFVLLPFQTLRFISMTSSALTLPSLHLTLSKGG